MAKGTSRHSTESGAVPAGQGPGDELVPAGFRLQPDPGTRTLAGGTVISFRVQLEDAAPYEAVYEETAEGNSLREMEALWDGLSGEAAPASQEELPS